MKLVYLTPFQFFGAIIIGILLSLTIGGMLMSPDPVNEPAQVITPVPTPREVYVQPTYQHPTPQQQHDVQPNEPITVAEAVVQDASTGFGLLGMAIIITTGITILMLILRLVEPIQ